MEMNALDSLDTGSSHPLHMARTEHHRLGSLYRKEVCPVCDSRGQEVWCWCLVKLPAS